MQVEQQSVQSNNNNIIKTVEFVFNGESKIGQLAVSPSEDNWDSLEKLFFASFPSIEAGAAVQAKYTDDEGDLVVLDSDDELRLALNNATKPLRLEFSVQANQPEKNRNRRTREERLQSKAERLRAKEEKLKIRLDHQQAREERIQKKRAFIEEKLKRKQERQEKKEQGILRRENCVASKEEKQKRREERLRIREERIKAKEEKQSRKEGCLAHREEKMKRREEKQKRCQERRKRKAASATEAEGSEAGAQKQKRRERCNKRNRKNGSSDEMDLDKSNIAFFDLGKVGEKETAWPEHATELFLDGNNMLFLTAGLRNLTLHRNTRGKAEQLLEAAAHAFVISQAGKIQKATVIFDNTCTYKSVTLDVADSQVAFRVCSARPDWATSDDALIEWAHDAQKRKEGGSGPGAECMAVVTSDRGLSVQLQQLGATLLKPKQFLHFAFKAVTNNEGTSGDAELDAWLESLIA